VDFFDRPEMLGESIATLRLLHYEGGQETGHAFVSDGYFPRKEHDESCRLMFFLSPGKVSDPAKGVYGAGAHSDYGLITLLATDDVVGLQVIHLEPMPSLAVLFGSVSAGGFTRLDSCRYARTRTLSLNCGNT
jgi:isopenicillin N synthase-like dioxygenase